MMDQTFKGWSLAGISGAATPYPHACNCIGPQPGHKVCPCMETAQRRADAEKAAPYLARIRELEEENRRLKAADKTEEKT